MTTPIRIDTKDLHSAEVDSYVEMQSYLRRDVGPVNDQPWLIRIVYANWFYLSICAMIGGLADTKIILSPLRAEAKSLDHRTANADHVARIRRELCDRHWTMLYVATFIVVAACLLRIGGPSDVSLVWPHIRLPEMCASRAIFGIECPGCGLTRSFVALASGDFAASLQFHRLGWLLALAVVAQFPYRAYALRRMRSGIVAHRWPVWFGYFLIAALLVNWLLKVCGV